jgi:hypothetical protein
MLFRLMNVQSISVIRLERDLCRYDIMLFKPRIIILHFTVRN